MRRPSMIESVLAALLAALALTLTGQAERVHAASFAPTLQRTTTLQLGLRINNRCIILATPITFPATYVSRQAAPLDAVGTLFVDCDPGRRASIRLSQGDNPDPSSTSRNPLRRMRFGTTSDYLNYNLYEDSGYTRVWDDDRPGVKTVRTWPVTLPVYARIDGGQTVTAPATYTDAVVARLFF